MMAPYKNGDEWTALVEVLTQSCMVHWKKLKTVSLVFHISDDDRQKVLEELMDTLNQLPGIWLAELTRVRGFEFYRTNCTKYV